MGKQRSEKSYFEDARLFNPLHCQDLSRQIHYLYNTNDGKDPSYITKELRKLAHIAPSTDTEVFWKASCLLLADMADQGFLIGYNQHGITITPPSSTPQPGESIDSVKARSRKGLKTGRDRQLKEDSVRKFIRKMQRLRKFEGQWVSVLSLVDDGFDLADQMATLSDKTDAHREMRLAQLIKPVVQVCTPNDRCATTGLNLNEIWRYFRHTWTLEYRSIPGRTMPVLIRNEARPNKPVIGISMLASPAMRLGARDNWIGWDRKILQKKFEEKERSGSAIAKMLMNSIKDAILNVRSDDLYEPEKALMKPTDNDIFVLEQTADGADHKRNEEIVDQPKAYRIKEAGKNQDKETDYFIKASESNLFVRKRASSLARLLGSLITFNKAELNHTPDASLKYLFTTNKGKQAIEIALTELRNNKIASQIADLSVCGAIPPYNEILGGKLVTLLMTSKEVRDLYKNRYDNHISDISSKVAGKPIKRKSDLLLLTTTSLYGMGSSQYNRLRINKKHNSKLPFSIDWMELGRTEGYGCIHLSNETLVVLKELAKDKRGLLNINYIFGEGAGARLRQIRQGVSALGLDPDDILNHANPRIIYACRLLPNATDILMGFEEQKIPHNIPTVAQITKAWIQRWLINRTKREETLQRLCRLGPEKIRQDLCTDEEGQIILPLKFDD